MLKYFNLAEFDSPDLPGSGEMMEPECLEMLDLARDLYGAPMIVTSGFRTVAHNKAVNGSRRSSHMLGYAADIACTNSMKRYHMIVAFLNAGFTRIGVGENFIHVDCDPNKPNPRLWTYE
jgi:uncharacterized protein YcbK (DUF882 family)